MAFNLFWIFFKMGLLCFGGGAAMIGVFERILVMEKGYLTSAQYADMVAISQITPGPIAVNMATYTGAAVGGSPLESVFFACAATIGISLPAFIYIVTIAKFFKQFGESQAVKSVMGGIRPGVIGLIIASVLLLCRFSIYNSDALLAGDFVNAFNLGAVALCCAALVISLKTKINPVAVLIGSGIIGIFIFR